MGLYDTKTCEFIASSPLPGQKIEQRGEPSALATELVGARVAPQRCPILRTSSTILAQVKVGGFSKLIFWPGGWFFEVKTHQPPSCYR